MVPAGGSRTSLLASRAGPSCPVIDPSRSGVETPPGPPAPTSEPSACAGVPGGEGRSGRVRPPPGLAANAAGEFRARPPSSPLGGGRNRLGDFPRTVRRQVSAAAAVRGNPTPFLPRVLRIPPRGPRVPAVAGYSTGGSSGRDAETPSLSGAIAVPHRRRPVRRGAGRLFHRDFRQIPPGSRTRRSTGPPKPHTGPAAVSRNRTPPPAVQPGDTAAKPPRPPDAGHGRGNSGREKDFGEVGHLTCPMPTGSSALPCSGGKAQMYPECPDFGG